MVGGSYFVVGALLALAITVAAGTSSGADPTMVAHRLVENGVVATDSVGVQNAALGHVTRPILAAPFDGFLFPPKGPPAAVVAGSDGTVELPFACPPTLAGDRIVLSVALAGFSWLEPARCPKDTTTPLRVRISRLNPGETVQPMVVANGAPSTPLKSRALQVGPTAVLHVALGASNPHASPVRFRIRGRPPGGPSQILLDQTVAFSPQPDDREWVDVEVPLGNVVPRAGGHIRLAFQATPVDRSAWPAVPVWGDPTVFDAATRSPSPNVVLISLDTLRADRLGCYGGRSNASPTLDRLAAGGTLFETAIAPAPWTLPSHLTMLSGVYACVHGLVTGSPIQRLPADLPTLPQLLHRRGYATAAFTEGGYLLPDVFKPGFDVFSSQSAAERAVERTVSAAQRWLALNARAPFLLFVHTYQLHAPYQSPPPHRGMFARPGVAGTEAQLDAYDAALHYADATLAPLLAALTELRIEDRTIVIVTSDHGEAFNEHGTVQHGNAMYDEVLRVPFIWRAPGLVAVGRRVDTLVGLIDVVPTLFDLLGIPASPLVQGRSLTAFLRPDAGPPARAVDRVLFAENSWEEPYALVARSQTWKAFFDADGSSRVYALATDPQERDATFGTPFAPAAAAARRQFEEDCARRKALRGASVQTPSNPPGTVDPQVKERLRALGYLE